MCANDHCDTKTRGANATAVRDRRPGAGRHTSSVIAATSGAVAIGDLRVAAGVSSTHLAQRFKELIGVTPKRLARTYRLASTVLAINPAIPIDWGDLAGGARYFDQAHFGHEFRAFTGLTPTRYVEVRRRFLRDHPGHVSAHDTPIWGHPKAEESPVGKVVMYASVSVDGFVAEETTSPGRCSTGCPAVTCRWTRAAS
jgi:AraC-like DNA-binding protein